MTGFGVVGRPNARVASTTRNDSASTPIKILFPITDPPQLLRTTERRRTVQELRHEAGRVAAENAL
jgi:hypothetical protein